MPRILHREGREGREERKEGITFRCFKSAKNWIWLSWDSQISQTVYFSLQLQNHMGFRFGSSWRVAKKISKLPSRRVLLKNYAQLQLTKEFLLIWEFCECGFDHSNFKISLLRGSYEHPIDQKASQVRIVGNKASERNKLFKRPAKRIKSKLRKQAS